MYRWNWVRNAAYPTLKPTQDVLGPEMVIASRPYQLTTIPYTIPRTKKNPENATGEDDAQSERQARAAAHANTSIM